jgi:hypothetical protein
MAPDRARDERKERQWRRRISEWRAGGLSVRDFCARHGLAGASFHARRRVLGRRAAEQPAFAPVQVVADATPTQASALRVVLLGGRTVRIAPGFDAATLCRLLTVRGGRAELPPAVRIWSAAAQVDLRRSFVRAPEAGLAAASRANSSR